MATAYRADRGLDIRTELRARIDQIDRDFRLLSIGELGRRVDAVRRMAVGKGLRAAARLAGSMSDALARDGRAAMIHPYVEGLREAIACDPDDERAGDAILASVSVRLVG
jgi:hypothetical protein